MTSEVTAGVAQTFTAHNIALADGSQTLPGRELTADSALCQAVLRDLRLAFFRIPPQMVRVADLGCLEGGYSVALARAGYPVTGIEARAENMACCAYALQRTELPNLGFIKADVRDTVALAPAGAWDAVLCLGLLYHLENPVAFLSQLGKAASRLLIVDSHYSAHPDAMHEGHRGHWYTEGSTRWSAWKNERSFWLARADLMAAIREAGFTLVFEQADHRDDMIAGNREDRGLFVGVKA